VRAERERQAQVIIQRRRAVNNDEARRRRALRSTARRSSYLKALYPVVEASLIAAIDARTDWGERPALWVTEAEEWIYRKWHGALETDGSAFTYLGREYFMNPSADEAWRNDYEGGR